MYSVIGWVLGDKAFNKVSEYFGTKNECGKYKSMAPRLYEQNRTPTRIFYMTYNEFGQAV